MTNPISEFRKPLNKAIKQLAAEHGIKGALYFYKRGECTCCDFPKDVEYMIAGNYASNQGCYGGPYEKFGYRVSFPRDQAKANKIAAALSKALEDTSWTLSWNGDVTTCMYIQKQFRSYSS